MDTYLPVVNDSDIGPLYINALMVRDLDHHLIFERAFFGSNYGLTCHPP